jgi:hypothetical protein
MSGCAATVSFRLQAVLRQGLLRRRCCMRGRIHDRRMFSRRMTVVFPLPGGPVSKIRGHPAVLVSGRSGTALALMAW